MSFDLNVTLGLGDDCDAYISTNDNKMVGCGREDLNLAMGLVDSNGFDESYNIDYSKSSDEADSNGDDEISNKGDAIRRLLDRNEGTNEVLTNEIEVGCGRVDLNLAMGLVDSHVSDESYNIDYSKSSDKADSNGDDEISKKGDAISQRLDDLSDDVIELMDVEGSQSKEEANSNEDGETSRKFDDSNRINEGHDGRGESNRMPHGHDGTSSSDLANHIEKKLEVGCSVVGVDQCYLLYCEYARLSGFSVRRGDQRYIGRTNELRWKEFTCSCSGCPDRKSSKHRVADYRKLVLRSNCEAKIIISREDLTWKIIVFVKSHNHPLVDIDQSYLLRSSRRLSFAKEALLEAMHSSGIPLNKACQFMEKMSGGVQNTGYIRKDAYNHFDKKRRVTRLDDGDSMALIEYFNRKSNTDPFFFWKVEKDDDGRLMNFFFRDSRCASDYKAFGDVLSLDTTGGTNRYKLACAPFVGVNHHNTNVMFGIGFLSDERTSSFNWLLDAFLESMDGVAPKVVFTDQCKALMNAVDSRFANATHRLCQWHINRNAMSHFGKLAGDASFKASWNRCMDGVRTEDEFEDLWKHMKHSYKIPNRAWFDTTYGLRRRWASVFSKNVFTAGLRATSRSEVTNKVLKVSAKSTVSLYEFICLYEDIQSRWRDQERVEDTHCIWLPGQFVNDSKLLTHAATIYTRSIYKVFERECTKIFTVDIDFDQAVSLCDGNIQYNVSGCGEENEGEEIVVFTPSSNCATCSCRKWESEGLLCRHILKVYVLKSIHAIPERYILKRWTKKAKNMITPIGSPHTNSSLLASTQFVFDITRMVYELACSESPEARKDIAETIFALRDRLLNSSDGASISYSPKKKSKSKANADILFHDPKKPKRRILKSSQGNKRRKVGITQPRSTGLKSKVVAIIDLNSG